MSDRSIPIGRLQIAHLSFTTPKGACYTAAMRLALAAVLLIASLSGAGCATTTGLVTGAFTGAVDLPAEVVRHHDTTFDGNPILLSPTVLVLAPVGFVSGPIMGLIKGFALDIEWLIQP